MTTFVENLKETITECFTNIYGELDDDLQYTIDVLTTCVTDLHESTTEDNQHLVDQIAHLQDEISKLQHQQTSQPKKKRTTGYIDFQQRISHGDQDILNNSSVETMINFNEKSKSNTKELYDNHKDRFQPFINQSMKFGQFRTHMSQLVEELTGKSKGTTTNALMWNLIDDKSREMIRQIPLAP